MYIRFLSLKFSQWNDFPFVFDSTGLLRLGKTLRWSWFWCGGVDSTWIIDVDSTWIIDVPIDIIHSVVQRSLANRLLWDMPLYLQGFWIFQVVDFHFSRTKSVKPFWCWSRVTFWRYVLLLVCLKIYITYTPLTHHQKISPTFRMRMRMLMHLGATTNLFGM